MGMIVFVLAGLIALLIIIALLRSLFSSRSASAPKTKATKHAERRRIDVNSSTNKAAAMAAKAAEDQRRRAAEWARSPNNPANINSPLHPANPRNMNNPANPLSPLNPSNRNRNR
jgi:hypothetical protein